MSDSGRERGESDGPRWARRPEGSTWGDFGPDDQLGRLNLIGPEKVRQGVAEVREGRTFCLSLPLDLPGGNLLNPRRHPPVLRPTVRNGRPNMVYRLMDDDPNHTDVVCDDLAILHLQYSTQWDSFAHVGQMFDANGDGLPEPVFYNGFRGGFHIFGPSSAEDAGVPATRGPRTTSGARALGIENMAAHGVQGRGVLIDLHAHFGDARTLVGHDELMRVMQADGVVVEPGDMVLLHTGFGQMLVDMQGDPDPERLHGACAVLDGRDPRLLRWITDSGLSILAADNYAVEAHPATPGSGACATLPLHEHCLFKLGVHLGEIWWLTPLARWLREHGRSRFLLTAPPLRLPGAVGSPATPIATV
ncbi:MAG TPA: cyclase family protein [Burkholderiaceae bacterium]|nr:cyclase family protein [Burkholderiaceae bacterium]